MEYVNDKREGPAYSYYENEKPKILAYRKNDLLDGAAKEFNSKGELTKVIIYQNGEIIQVVEF